MKRNKTALALIKIGSKENQTALFEKGEIFMKPQKYFQDLRDNKKRGDKYEGSDLIEQLEWVKIMRSEKKIPVKIDRGNGVMVNLTTMYSSQPTSIYSMIGLSEDDIGFNNPIDKKNEKFGDYFTLIYNVKEFNRRILEKLKNLGGNPQWKWVNYYNEHKYEGRLDKFSKPMDYSYQKEVRFIANSTSNAPIKFQIGSLEDISILCSIESLKKIKLMTQNSIQIS